MNGPEHEEPQHPVGAYESKGDRQLPLVFFSIVLAVWVATWFGVYLFV